MANMPAWAPEMIEHFVRMLSLPASIHPLRFVDPKPARKSALPSRSEIDRMIAGAVRTSYEGILRHG